jgi:hypothetical protein
VEDAARNMAYARAKIKTVRKEGDQDEWYPERIIG